MARAVVSESAVVKPQPPRLGMRCCPPAYRPPKRPERGNPFRRLTLHMKSSLYTLELLAIRPTQPAKPLPDVDGCVNKNKSRQ